MRAVIICGGNVGEYINKYIEDGDFIICADSGYDRAKSCGISPDIVIGDMDSVESRDLPENKIVYPARKDFTDSELVVHYALEHGFSDVLLFGMIGTRMDHTLANISLLEQLKGINAVIIDEYNEIYFAESEMTICGNIGDTISIIPFGGDAVGVTTSGLDYPLSGGVIKSGTSLGVSNMMTAESCSIKIDKGTAFVIRSRD
ncbi:MAG: thiamine diphosphokinase [Clostridia bacterium]|nr:thiamine diphosphokinase [Clostridia bacterium]